MSHQFFEKESARARFDFPRMLNTGILKALKF
jgi:hypothetical protein